jgi:hypothetical protein
LAGFWLLLVGVAGRRRRSTPALTRRGRYFSSSSFQIGVSGSVASIMANAVDPDMDESFPDS